MKISQSFIFGLLVLISFIAATPIDQNVPASLKAEGPIRRPTAAAAPPDCEQFKAECKDLCLNHNPTSDGVWSNQCWGTPLYAECKCSDGKIFNIPGFVCKNPECPDRQQ